MKLNLILLVVASAALSACSSSSRDFAPAGPGGPPEPVLKSIPEQILIDPGSLVAVSDQVASDGIVIFKALMVAPSLQKQILIPNDESLKERNQRQDDLSHLSAAQQAAVASIRQRCQVSESPGPARSSLTFKENIHTGGADCPVALSRSSELTYTVQSSDAEGRTGSASISGTIDIHNEFHEEALAQAAKLKSGELTGKYRWLTQIEKTSTKTYFQISAGATAQLADGNSVVFNIRGEILETEDRRTIVYYVTASIAEHVYTFAARTEDRPAKIETVEFYSGDHKLTPTELSELHAEDLIRQF